jgi:RNA polymerase sigma-54 factor
MALEQRLSIRMSQRLVMTPSLQQAIKLLQMSKLELVDEIQQELLENPVLEESQSEPTSQETNEEDGQASAGDEESGEAFEDIDYEAYFANLDSESPLPPRREVREDLPSFETLLSKPQDLAAHLIWQLEMNVTDPTRKEIGQAIIGNLNHDGYLKATLEEIGDMGGWDLNEIEDTLGEVQGFDPVGVAARDLVECLCVQLKHLGQAGTPAESIVRHHMDKLQNRKFKELSTELELDMEDLEAEMEIIRGLDPRPGQRYNAIDNHYVIPDVQVVKLEDEYVVVLNDEGLPRLKISPVYRRMLARGGMKDEKPEAREYVRNKLRSAFRLIKSVEERQRTIFKVATAIVKFQREFLDYGIEKLKPLVLKDVAEEIGMHESTVSRVVNKKYMHTHRGLFEMRYFFHSGIASNRGGASVSSYTVKDKIRKIIQEEDPGKPLSDSAIVKILKAEGLKIARRTVAKYREEMKIPSSSSRKQSSL